MSDKKTKIECRLIARGTEKVETQADEDLSIPDPESTTGKKIIEKAMEEDKEDGDKSKGSG